MEEAVMADDEKESELNIARRTRSHLKIDGIEPSDNLDFPDVDMSLYQNPDSEGDTEYRQFLAQCYSQDIGSEANAEENDPEYVYNNDVLSHGWTFDLSGFHPPDDSMNQIDSERDPRYPNINQDVFIETNQFHTLSSMSHVCPKPSTVKSSNKIEMFNHPEFSRVLNQQLRQSIQLITQTYLLTKNTTNMQSEAEEAKRNLEEYMKMFKHKTKPSNLLPALELVKEYAKSTHLKSSIRPSWRPLPVPDNVRSIIVKNPNIFIYPSLMPQVAFSILHEKLVSKKSKTNFTLNEDKLLAYALNEFKGETSQYAFIASLLMSAKTKTQISNHIKNIKRSPGNENNPIRLFYLTGELPMIDLDSDSHLVEVRIEDDEETDNEASEKINISVDEVDINEKQQQQQSNNKEEVKQQYLQDQAHQYQEEHIQNLICQSHEIGQHYEKKEEQIPLELPQKEQVQEQVQVQEQAEEQDLRQDNSPVHRTSSSYQEQDDLMNMCLDDLMAASTTISKSTIINSNTNENNKNIRNLKLKKSMLNLMSHKLQLSSDMRDLIVQDFLKTAQQKLGENNFLELLRLLTNRLTSSDNQAANVPHNNDAVIIYKEISAFFSKIEAPKELIEKLVLFLDLEQATKCGCSFTYLHWMRFFEFMQHVEMNNYSGVDAIEKKLARLIDALHKDDQHKIKLAVGNLVNKHPFLSREFDSLALDEKPHPSLFSCEEDYDDITEPLSMYTNEFINEEEKSNLFKFEHICLNLSEEELSYASQACPCECHSESTATESGQIMQHCGKCNLKFMKGRMYLVNKIKPILAEWSYVERQPSEPPTPQKQTPPQNIPLTSTAPTTTTSNLSTPSHKINTQVDKTNDLPRPINVEWTFEEDRRILEFCRNKVEQSEETVSFDASTFEELINRSAQKRTYFVQGDQPGSGDGIRKSKTAQEIADRFNHLMDIYKRENLNTSGSSL